MDQLQMHITSAIHNTAWNVVYGHAMLSNTAELVSRNFFDVPSGLVNLKNIEKSSEISLYWSGKESVIGVIVANFHPTSMLKIFFGSSSMDIKLG